MSRYPIGTQPSFRVFLYQMTRETDANWTGTLGCAMVCQGCAIQKLLPQSKNVGRTETREPCCAWVDDVFLDRSKHPKSQQCHHVPYIRCSGSGYNMFMLITPERPPRTRRSEARWLTQRVPSIIICTTLGEPRSHHTPHCWCPALSKPHLHKSCTYTSRCPRNPRSHPKKKEHSSSLKSQSKVLRI